MTIKIDLPIFVLLLSFSATISHGQIGSFSDDFDPAINGANWSTLNNATASTNCGSVSGNAMYFTGSGTRQAITTALNTSGGGWIGFYIKISNESSPCENADAGEYVVLEYSTDNGSNWTTWQTFDVDDYVDFTYEQFTIIPAAQSSSTLLRWRQVTHSGGGNDNWALDNIIFSAIPDDAGVTGIDPPVVFCAGAQDVKATVTNYGTDTLFNVTVNWEFDSVLQTPVNYSTFIEPISASPNNTAVVTLGSKTFTFGQDYTVKAWTSAPNSGTDTVNYNDTLVVTRSTGLGGTYTIGGTSPDYADFTSAVNDLNLYGICQPVVFNVRNGTYNEQIALGEIQGTDVANTVTFQSESGDSSLAILSFSASSSANYTVYLNGADWVTFQNLTIEATNITYGRVVTFGENSHHNSFKNNLLRGVTTTSSSSNRAIVSSFNYYADYNVFENNCLENGAYGIYWDGDFNSVYTLGLQFRGNILKNQYYSGIYIFDQNGPKVEGNIVTSNSILSGKYGIYINNCDDSTRVVGNQVVGWENGYGMYLYSLDGTLTEQALVANNFVQIEGNGGYQGLLSYYGTYVNILYNTVQVLNDHVDAYAFYNYYGSNKILLNNNFVNRAGGYAIYVVPTTTITNSDYNNFYTNGTNLGYWNAVTTTLADWQAASSLDASSLSVDPLFVDSMGYAVTLVDLNAAAFPSALVMNDIEGDARDGSTPDIGADEFTPFAEDAALLTFTEPISPFAPGTLPIKVVLKNNGTATLTSANIDWELNGTGQTTYNWSGSLASGGVDTVSIGSNTFNAGAFYNLKAWASSPNGMSDPQPSNDTIQVDSLFTGLAGVYTIGGTSPDFSTFTEAVNALHNGGVVGAVTFNLRNGTYNEQIEINEIAGVDSMNTVVFQSETGDSTAVVLSFLSPSSQDFIVYLNGCDWVTFHQLTLEALGGSYAQVVTFGNNSFHNTLSSCVINAPTNTFDYSVYAADALADYTTFSNCIFNNGGYGIYWNGSLFNGNQTFGLKITGNQFNNQYYAAMYLFDLESPMVAGNEISTSSVYSSYFGLFMDDTDDSTKIIGNKVYGIKDGYGFYINDAFGTASAPVVISNNFIQYDDHTTSTEYGLYCVDGAYHYVVNNTVHFKNTGATSAAFINGGVTNLTLQNNLFANMGGGYAVYDQSNIVASDYNDFYATGPLLAYWNGSTFSNLPDLQTFTGYDINSLSVDPGFVSDTSYQITAVELDGGGTPSIYVPDDIEGETRDGSNPDIGADEFTAPTNDAALLSFANPTTPFAPGTQNVQVVLKNNGTSTLTTANIDWTINGAGQTTVNWSGSLASGATATVSLGNSSFTAGTTYNLSAWVSSPNGNSDPYPANDTTSANNLVAGLAGVYTIGGTSPDFLNFTEAVNALNTGGVVGAVTFNVRNGTYNEQITINEIAGASASQPVLFQSETGDSSAVSLEFDALGSAAPFTLRLNGADWVNFKKLSVKALDSWYHHTVLINGGTNNVEFSNCYFDATSQGGYTNFFVNSDYNDHIIFKNNHVINGYNGISLVGYSLNGEYADSNVVEYNIFEKHDNVGIWMSYQENIHVLKNHISATRNVGIYANQCYYGEIASNQVVDFVNIGLYLDQVFGDISNDFVVANNFVHADTSTADYGIYTYYGNYVLVAHNSVNFETTNTGATAYYNVWGSNKRILNNIFSNTGGGYAYYTNSPSPIIESDHNDLHATGTNLGYWNGNQTDLAAWQTASSKDANSLSVDPTFVSSTDLHTTNVNLNNAGKAVPEVTNDFDGDTRDPVKPDIGADEFFTSTEDAGVASIDEPVSPFAAGSQQVNVTVFNNGLDTMETVQVNWEVNGSLQTPLNWTGSLLSGESEDSVNVGSFIFEIDTMYTIRAWTTNPNGIADTINFNDTAMVDNLYAGLAGVYTIGGSSPDFDDFQSAVTAMTFGGVVGQVTFLVRDGTYDEQISISEITGVDATNTVTFQSETGDSTGVVLSYAGATSTDNYVLRLEGADYFRFKNMTIQSTSTSSYRRVIDIRDGANHNEFSNNEIIGSNINSTSSLYALVFSDSHRDDYNSFTSNRFIEGSYGLYLVGIGTATENQEMGTVVTGNSFEEQYAIGAYLYLQNAPVVEYNEFFTSSSSTGYDGIYAYYCYNSLSIAYNNVHDAYQGAGISVVNCYGTASLWGLIANNFISMGNGTGADGYGIYITSSNFQRVYHNSTRWNSTDNNNTYALYTSNCSNADIKNNIFMCPDQGHAFYKTSGSVTSNYNDLYTQGANLGYWDGTLAADLNDWRTTSGQDANSWSIDPLFASETDLHISEVDLNNTGTPLPQVTDDFDGEPRSVLTPDIGADEFSPVTLDDADLEAFFSPNNSTPFPAGAQAVKVVIKNAGSNELTTAKIHWQVNGLQQPVYNWSGMLLSGERDTVSIGNYNFQAGFGTDLKGYTQLPNGLADSNPSNDTASVDNLYAGLIGVYTIGGAFPDFPNFTTAANVLNNGGVLGPVTFNVRNGTYDEQIVLGQINGASASNPIVFQSQSGDSSLVKMRNQNNYSPDYIVQLNGSDHVTFRQMTFEKLGCCITTVFDFTGGADNNVLENCHFKAPVNNTGTIIVSNGGYKNNNNLIQNNLVENGGYGIYFRGQSASNLEAGNQVLNNTFINPYYVGVYMEDQDAPEIIGNTISTNSPYNSFDAIQCSYCDNGVEVSKNKINAANGRGIYLYYCDGTSADKGLVVNNFVQVGGTVTAYGIYYYQGTFINTYFNTVNITNTDANSRAFQNYYGSNKNVLNNVFANTGGGYASVVSGTSSISSMNFNDYFTTGANLGYWHSQNAPDLATWRSLSGKDLNSKDADPLFYSPTDLHVLQVALDSAATPVVNIPVDIDMQARDANYPDIGADEFDYLTDDLGVTALVRPVDTCEIGSAAVVEVRIQNFGGLPQTAFNVAYRLNGGAEVLENVGALSVPPGGTANYTFATTADISAFLVHDFEAYTLLPGDLNTPNDTASFTVQNYQTPTTPSNMLPANGTVNVDPPINFSWLPSAGATRYDLYLWRQGNPVPSTPTGADLQQISFAYNSNSLVYGAVYEWQLVAKNAHCETAGPVQQFTLRELPDLIAKNVSVPVSPFSGSSIEVSWEVENLGLGSTGMKTWYDYVYLSTDNAYQAGVDTYLGGFANFTALNGAEEYSNMKNVMLPVGIQGTYYIIVITDRNNNVIEGNDNNNTSVAASMTVQLTPPPDLVVQSIIAPNNAFSGSTVNITWTIENQGTGDVPTGNGFYDYIYISENAVYDPNDATYLGRYWSAPIAVNATHTRNQNVTIPNYEFGDRYIHILTDRQNHVFEYVFEDNNTGNSSAINVILTPPPDLVAHSLSIVDTVSNKQSVAVSWTVENQGANPTTGYFYDKLYISNHHPFDPDSVTSVGSYYYGPVIGTGASINRSYNVTIPANITGQRYYYVETDATDRIFEFLNENNNVSDAASTVVVNADLVVDTSIFVDTVYSGEVYPFTWTVRNDGMGSVLNSSRTDRIYLSTNAVFNQATSTLVGSLNYNNNMTPGQSLTKQTDLTIPNGIFGDHYLHIITDDNNNVFENLNEGNNFGLDSVHIMLSPWADMQVDTITGLPDSTIGGNLLTLNYVVQNHGTKAVDGISGGWVDRVYISANPSWNPANAVKLHDINVLQSLPINGTYSKTWSFNIPMLPAMQPTGICYIYIFSDVTDKIYEYTDEGNNVKRSNPIYVESPDPVDFDALNATALPDTVWSGQQVNLQWSIKNIGNTTALWSYPLWYDGVYMCEDSIWHPDYEDFIKDFTKQGPVVSGQTYSNGQSFNIPNGKSGDYYFFLVADHTNLTNDTAFSNNVQKVRPGSYPTGQHVPVHIKLTPSPDLEVNTFLAPSNGISGQPIQVIWTVTNLGPGNTSGTWSDKVYLSTDFNISGNDKIIGNKSQSRVLAPGQSYTDTMDAFIPITSSGNFILIFKTDANNVVFENNSEANNVFYNYLTATLPMPSDLFVDSISFPTMAMVGEPFTVNYSVRNQGVNPSTGVMRDIVYFSADSVFDVSDVPFIGPFQRNINLAPNSNVSGSFTDITPGVPLGNYFIIVQTDALNNIFESTETNNVTISTQKVMVSVQELPLDSLTGDTLMNNTNLYYRIEIPDTLAGETMMITLDGTPSQGANELYVSHGTIPTRSMHDYSFPNAFSPDQAIVVPEIDSGQYYLLAYGASSFGFATGKQHIDLLAEIIPFEILSVDDVKGGNTGNVTVRLDGAKFTPTMEVRLEDGSLGTHIAHTITFINSTRVFATFNLSGANLGLYDVVAEKTPEVATLVDGFEIVAGGSGTTTSGGPGGGFFCNIVNVGTEQNLSKNYAYPASIRVNRIVPITIQFGNNGNVDIPCPARFIISLRGAPLSFNASDFSENHQELYLEFQEVGGPTGILRPGSFSSLTVYSYSSHPLRFLLKD